MNGSHPPRRTSRGEDLSPALGLGIMLFGGLAFWWWQLGGEARSEWMSRIGSGSGYGPAPRDMVEQIEWLLANRLQDLQEMFPLFVMAATAGILEGNVRRQALALSGFGLRRFQFGRALLLVWLGLAALAVAAPAPLRYGTVATVLAVTLFGAMYNIGRGLRRVQ